MRLADGRHVMNPGSVGLPAYAEDEPFPHKNESGSPHARYAIVERSDDGFSIDMRAVAYDWQAAATIAAARGRHIWVAALQTGRA